MKAYCIQLITLSCLVGFQNYMLRCSVACKDHVASLKVKVVIHNADLLVKDSDRQWSSVGVR